MPIDADGVGANLLLLWRRGRRSGLQRRGRRNRVHLRRSSRRLRRGFDYCLLLIVDVASTARNTDYE
jgi:hypothetical protein